jgi:hypothetical protein
MQNIMRANADAYVTGLGRGQGECGPTKHALDSAPVKRVTGVGSHTANYCRQYPRWEPYAGKPHTRQAVLSLGNRVNAGVVFTHLVLALCPQLVEADIRALQREFGF